jgi:hypothetical protein
MRVILFIALASALTLPSCKFMYAPNAHNVPLLKERGEIRANVGISNYQTAIATGKHMGVLTSGYYKKNTWSLNDYRYTSKRWLSEGGSGTFFTFGEKGVFEVYAGGGGGEVTFDRYSKGSNGAEDLLVASYSAKVIKTFFQPAVGVSGDNLDFAFSVRYTGLKFNNIDTVGYTELDLVANRISKIDKPFYSFIEPALTLRAGGKWVKGHMQVLGSIKLNEEKLNYFPVAINFGVNVCIAKRNMKKKDKGSDDKKEDDKKKEEDKKEEGNKKQDEKKSSDTNNSDPKKTEDPKMNDTLKDVESPKDTISPDNAKPKF